METSTPFLKRRLVWAAVVGLGALAFWVVGLGTGMRGWILSDDARGIVAHAQAFGEQAYIWWIPATVIGLTAVVMASGASIVRHLVDGPTEVLEPREALEPKETLEPKEPVPSLDPADGPIEGRSDPDNPAGLSIADASDEDVEGDRSEADGDASKTSSSDDRAPTAEMPPAGENP